MFRLSKPNITLLQILTILSLIYSCSPKNNDYVVDVYQTSQSGDNLKLILNEESLAADLESNWAVVAEAIQTVLRREGYPKPYEALKELTRTNSHITKESISTFIDTLNVDDTIKAELKNISPSNFTGI